MPKGRRTLIERCRLGYCTGQRSPDLIAALRQRGIPIEAARESGLLSQQGEQERFAGRLIIPEIRAGAVIWITGRLVKATSSSNQQRQKYLNLRGPRHLLGAERMTEAREVILVESPMDYLTLVLWGYRATAMLGGTLPRADVPLFADLERIYVPHHADEAGWNATCRLVEHLGERIWTIFLPATIYGQPVKDVNDLAWRGANPYLGRQLFEECGQQAVPWDDQLWRGAYTHP